MHTPGPWTYESSTRTIRSQPTNYWLATMDSWDGAVNNEANARLIAAAPDLLAALEALQTDLQKRRDAKYEGSMNARREIPHLVDQQAIAEMDDLLIKANCAIAKARKE